MAHSSIKNNDILLGRGPFCYRNPGNVKFRNMIQSHVTNYVLDAPQSSKKKVVQSLIKKIREQGIRFLIRSKKDSNWCEAQHYVVQLKVSHALRDARNMLAI
jgi:hypothetical protein